MYKKTPYRVDIVEPAGRAEIIGMVGELRAERVWPSGDGRVVRMVPVIHGQEQELLISWSQLAMLAHRHITETRGERADRAAQPARRLAPDALPAGPGGTDRREARPRTRHPHGAG